MATANTEYLVKLIEAELDRLGASDGYGKTGGIAVVAEDDLPDGWVKVCDESGEADYGLASDVLDALRNTDPEDATDDEGKPSGWVAAWEAVTDLVNPQFHSEPTGSDIWNDFHEFTGVEMSGGLGLIVIRTNGGLRYGYAPTGSDFSAFNTTHDFSVWHSTAAEAIEAAERFKAEEVARS